MVDDGVDLGVPLADVVMGIHGASCGGALDRLCERWGEGREPLRDALTEARDLSQAKVLQARRLHDVGAAVEVVEAGAWG